MILKKYTFCISTRQANTSTASEGVSAREECVVVTKRYTTHKQTHTQTLNGKCAVPPGSRLRRQALKTQTRYICCL